MRLKIFENNEGFYTMIKHGIVFHNCDVFTAWFSGCEETIITGGNPANPETTVDIFARFGKVVEIQLPDEDLIVISTPQGPLEIYKKWNGGIPTEGVYTILDHHYNDIKAVKKDDNFDEQSFIHDWEQAYHKMDFLGNYVYFKMRD